MKKIILLLVYCFFVQSTLIAQNEILVKKFKEGSSLTKVTDENNETIFYLNCKGSKMPLGKADVAYKGIDRLLKLYESSQPEVSNTDVTESDFSLRIGGIAYKVTLFSVPIQGTEGIILSASYHLDFYIYPADNPVVFTKKPEPGLRMTEFLSGTMRSNSRGQMGYSYAMRTTEYSSKNADFSTPPDGWCIFIQSGSLEGLKPFNNLVLVLEKEKRKYEKEQVKLKKEQRKLEKIQKKSN